MKKTRKVLLRKIFCNPKIWKLYRRESSNLKMIHGANKSGKTESFTQEIIRMAATGELILNAKGNKIFKLAQAKKLFGYRYWKT